MALKPGMDRVSQKAKTGCRERQQVRRFRARELFVGGRSRAEVAQKPSVSWRTVHGWWQLWHAEGFGGLECKTEPGPLPLFSDGQVEERKTELLRGAIAHGYACELRTLHRVARLVREGFGLEAAPSEAWRLLKRMGWSLQKPLRKAWECDEEKHRQWNEAPWPGREGLAENESLVVPFAHESGFSQNTTAKKTGDPSGETPMKQMKFNGDKLSVIHGISLKSMSFQIRKESLESEQVIGYLTQLHRYVKMDWLVVLVGLPAHRSQMMAQYLGQQRGRIFVGRLLACMPELKPIAYFWGNVKGDDRRAPSNKFDLRLLSSRQFQYSDNTMIGSCF